MNSTPALKIKIAARYLSRASGRRGRLISSDGGDGVGGGGGAGGDCGGQQARSVRTERTRGRGEGVVVIEPMFGQ